MRTETSCQRSSDYFISKIVTIAAKVYMTFLRSDVIMSLLLKQIHLQLIYWKRTLLPNTVERQTWVINTFFYQSVTLSLTTALIGLSHSHNSHNGHITTSDHYVLIIQWPVFNHSYETFVILIVFPFFYKMSLIWLPCFLCNYKELQIPVFCILLTEHQYMYSWF